MTKRTAWRSWRGSPKPSWPKCRSSSSDRPRGGRGPAAEARSTSELAKDGDYLAHDAAFRHGKRLHGGVLGDEQDPPVLDMEALDRGLILCRSRQEGCHDVAFVGRVLALDDHDIAVEDPRSKHGIALHVQGEVIGVIGVT